MDDTFQHIPFWAWAVFGGVLALFLTIDLLVHRGGRHESRGLAIVWSIIWVGVGLAFTLFVWPVAGPRAAQEYLAAYLIEKSLSLDNLFVFLIIFRTLRIPRDHQRTALSWGIFAALVFRAIFVVLGAAALREWQWVEYIFGAILLYAAWHSVREDPSAEHDSKLVHWLERHLPVTSRQESPRFFVRVAGRLKVTPLLIAVLALETTDIIFAIDSVPAALSVTQNVFIVYSSNAFAILGLRALYIVLARTLGELKYLHYGIAGVLAFAALKLISHRWFHVPPMISVAIIVLMVGAAIIASVWHRRRTAGRTEATAEAVEEDAEGVEAGPRAGA